MTITKLSSKELNQLKAGNRFEYTAENKYYKKLNVIQCQHLSLLAVEYRGEYFVMTRGKKGNNDSLAELEASRNRILAYWPQFELSAPIYTEPGLLGRKVYLSLMDSKDDYAALKPGDIVTRRSSKYNLMIYQHFGVYIGNGEIIHFDTEGDSDGKSGATIHKTTWNDFVHNRGFISVLRGKDIEDAHRAICKVRAEELLLQYEEHNNTDDVNYMIEYSAWMKNCEHFARFCMFGDIESNQKVEVLLDLFFPGGSGIVNGILSVLSIFWDVGSFCLVGTGAFGSVLATAFEPVLGLAQLMMSIAGAVKNTIQLFRSGDFSFRELWKIIKVEIGINAGRILTGLLIIAVSVTVLILLILYPPSIGIAIAVAVATTLLCIGLFVLGKVSKVLIFKLWNHLRTTRVPGFDQTIGEFVSSHCSTSVIDDLVHEKASDDVVEQHLLEEGCDDDILRE